MGVSAAASPATSSLENPGAVTFSHAGTYAVSFTVTDSAGNTDPQSAGPHYYCSNRTGPGAFSGESQYRRAGKSNLNVTLNGQIF